MAAWDSLAPYLSCPLCDAPLSRRGAALVCRRAHAFDIARAGYCNLLPPARRGAPPPGDSREMVLARRRFLDGGHYAPLADAIAGLAARCLAGDAGARVGHVGLVDAGCGEGYYLERVRNQLRRASVGTPIACLGLDISREAIGLAARRAPDAAFLVADIRRRLPCRTAALHLLLNIFAPRNAREFARVLAPGGHLIVAIPAAAHLAELRATFPLLGMQPDKRNRVLALFAGDFALVESLDLGYDLALDGDGLADLVQMLPRARPLPPAVRAEAGARASFRTAVGFEILLLRRT